MLPRALCTGLIAVVAILAYTVVEAQQCFQDFSNPSAVVNFGNGLCDAGEGPGECAELKTSSGQISGFVIEICPSTESRQFPIPTTYTSNNQTQPASQWRYVIKKGSATTISDNFVDFSIAAPPAVEFLQVLGSNNISPYAPGAGDPNTSFGAGDITSVVIRVPFNIDPQDGATVSIITKPAGGALRPVLLKSGKNSFLGAILQADGPLPGGNLTTLGTTNIFGVAVTITNDTQGNVVNCQKTVGNNPTSCIVVALSQAYICIPAQGFNHLNIAPGYRCAPIAAAFDGAFIESEVGGCLVRSGRLYC